MKHKAIQYFRRGRWLRLATQCITNPQQVRELVDMVSQYTHRNGLKRLRHNTTLLWHYLSHIASGEYTHYNKRALLLVVAGLIYLVTPVDFLPDILLGGLIDDLGVVLYIVKSTSKELSFYDLYRQGHILGEK